jgi:hypothetical protein
MQRPEDVARIPGSRWLIFSGFADGSGIKLVDTSARTMRPWYSGDSKQLRQDRKRYGRCPGPPDAARFNAQGISLRTQKEGGHTLYVANHGGRESIEVFSIDASGAEPTLTWIGCVLMPDSMAANSVASYSDGTLIASVLTRPGTSITDFVLGRITGRVYEWTPGSSDFKLLPGTELPGDNGLETSLDDKEFYVVAFGWHSVLVFDRHDTAKPLRSVVAPGFMPDNIHWTDGRLLLAGMQYDEPACGGTRKVIDGKADPMLCHRGYTVAEFDPQSLNFSIVAYGEPDPVFNGVSAAVIVGNELWLASFQSDRVAFRPLPGAKGGDRFIFRTENKSVPFDGNAPGMSEKILPAGDHRDLVVRTCAVCHPADLVVAKRRTEQDWDDIIARMVERGAVATEDEQILILDYFVKHFGM